MTASLIEIASSLAVENPAASTQEIVDAIFDSIESPAIISAAVSHVTVPAALRLREAKFVTKRIPKERAKERERILERIDNAKFVKRLQELYIPIRGDSTVATSNIVDGAHVSQFPLTRSQAAAYGELKHQIRTNRSAAFSSHFHDDAPRTYTRSIAQESAAMSNRQINVSSSDILEEVEKTVSSNEFLSFYNIYQLITLIKLFPHENEILARIAGITRAEINHRNRIFKTDCVRELYQGECLMPEDMRFPHFRISVLTEWLRESLGAIILNEYRQLNDQAGHHFINNNISYDKYMDMMGLYAIQADELLSALQ